MSEQGIIRCLTPDPELNLKIQAAIAEAVAEERAKGVTDAIAAMVFEPGKSYLALVAEGAIDGEVLRSLPPGPEGADCNFVFVSLASNRTISEIACQVDITPPGNLIFVEEG